MKSPANVYISMLHLYVYIGLQKQVGKQKTLIRELKQANPNGSNGGSLTSPRSGINPNNPVTTPLKQSSGNPVITFL